MASLLYDGSEIGSELYLLVVVVCFGVAPAFIAIWLATTDSTLA